MPLQLDAFHALCEAYDGMEHWPWPSPIQTRAKQKAEERQNALEEILVGTVVWRTFTDARAGKGRYRAVVISNRPVGG